MSILHEEKMLNKATVSMNEAFRNRTEDYAKHGSTYMII